MCYLLASSQSAISISLVFGLCLQLTDEERLEMIMYLALLLATMYWLGYFNIIDSIKGFLVRGMGGR